MNEINTKNENNINKYSNNRPGYSQIKISFFGEISEKFERKTAKYCNALNISYEPSILDTLSSC